MMDWEASLEMCRLADERKLSLPLRLYAIDGEEYAVLKDGTLGGLAPNFDLGPHSGERLPKGAEVRVVVA